MARVEMYAGWEQTVYDAVRPGFQRKAERVEDWAKATVPVDTGRLRDSIDIEELRRGFRVWMDTEYAVYVEFGTRYMNGYHTLGRALDVAKG